MSEKKKSFILYNDYRKHIGMLSDEDAGRLFKAIYCLVNSEEPPELSPMAQMALSFISEQLERDAKKWEETRKKRSEAAKLRWDNTNMANKAIQNDANDANAYGAVQSDANDAVNDTVNDNVNEDGNASANEYVNDNINESVFVTDDGTVNDGVPITEKQMAELVGLSSVSSAENYLNKLSLWQKRTGKHCHDPYSTIKRWILQDKANSKNADGYEKPSYDLDEFEKFAMGTRFAGEQKN